jgi:hypothetical protein
LVPAKGGSEPGHDSLKDAGHQTVVLDGTPGIAFKAGARFWQVPVLLFGRGAAPVQSPLPVPDNDTAPMGEALCCMRYCGDEVNTAKSALGR